MSGPIPRELSALASHPLLSPEEEHRLAVVMRDGLPAERAAAREKLILSNLRLVARIALQHTGRGMDFEDLFSAGCAGLTTAVDRFDPERGTRLSTTSFMWIRQRIQREVAANAHTIRLPDQIRKAQLTLSGESDLTDAEVAKRNKISTKRVRAARNAPTTISIDAPPRDSDASPVEMIEDEFGDDPYESAERADVRERVTAALDVLDDDERLVIALRHGVDGLADDELKPSRIADELGISLDQVRKLEASALEKLRDVL